MTERQREDAVLAELESLRKRLHQIVDQRTDQLFLTILLGDRMASLPEGEVLCPFVREPAAFKGNETHGCHPAGRRPGGGVHLAGGGNGDPAPLRR